MFAPHGKETSFPRPLDPVSNLELDSDIVARDTSPSKPRRYPRVDLQKGITVAWQAKGQRTVSKVITLGLGGVFILTPKPPEVGTLLKLLFQLPGGEVRAVAVVRNARLGKGMGIEFIGMDFSARARLQQVLNQLQSEDPPSSASQRVR